MTRFLTLLFAATLAILPTVGHADPKADSKADVVDTAVAAGNFKTLVTAV